MFRICSVYPSEGNLYFLTFSFTDKFDGLLSTLPCSVPALLTKTLSSHNALQFVSYRGQCSNM